MVQYNGSEGTPRPGALSTVEAGQHLRLLIVSEVRFLREALAEALRCYPTITVLGLCANLADAIAACLAQQLDMVLLDAAFCDGPTAVRHLRAAVPESPVVVLAVDETPETVIAWAEAGAIGYVPQTTALADLVSILISISHGSQHCSAQITSGLLRHVARTARSDLAGSTPALAATLTRREREISLLIGAGLSNKEIARRLDIGVATTKSHVHNLLGKMNVQYRGQAAARLGTSGSGMGESR